MGDRIRWIERIPGYHYYDTPDGEDCLKKVVFMNKMAIFFGVAVGTLDVISYSKVVGFSNIAGRYVKITYPFMAIGSTFAAVTCLSTSIREKDDTYNYAWGGLASGCIAGAAYRSGTFGTFAAVMGTVLGYVYKQAVENDIPIWDSRPRPFNFGGLWSIKYDWSLTEERPRGWKKSADE